MIERKLVVRLVIVAVLLCLALGGVAARLVELHLTPADSVRERLERGRRLRQVLVARRGRILDGSPDANIVALSLPVKDVWIDPKIVRESGSIEQAAAALARDLDLDPQAVLLKVDKPDRRYEVLRRAVPEQKALQMPALRLKGVGCDDLYARHYPHGAFMCHVIGFANAEGVGSAGVEQWMEKHLRGSPGLLESKMDARKRELYVRRLLEVQPQSGADVVITVDQNIQYVVEKALAQAVERNQAKGGWSIVQRIRTGEILAMASLPAYDLNDFRRASEAEKLNRAIGMVYEPGSTLKAAVIAAALNERIVTPSQVFDCENGAWTYAGRVLRDFHPYGNLTVADIVKKSSNIGTAKIALLLGEERLESYLRAFGLGSRLGIDLPGEETGILHPVSRWSNISITRIGMGQGVAVTALQMVGLFAAIANDGFLMKPHIVRRVVRPDGAIVWQARPEVIARPLRGETAATMRQLLWRVTEEGGTGRRACVEGYKVAGKTGTAQKPIPGGYSDTACFSSFVGFLPVDEPEIALIVVIDEPQPAHTGGAVAAPVFSEIAEQVVRYLGIPATPHQIADLRIPGYSGN